MGKLMMNEKLNPVSTQGDAHLTWLRRVTFITGIDHRISCVGVDYLKINRLEYHE